MISFRKLKYLLPHGVIALLNRLSARRNTKPLPTTELQANRALRRIEAGKRCFILGNGPSLHQVDLTQLAGQNIISVSNGYLHPDYKSLSPIYHCIPQVTYGKVTEADVVTWFTEMHEHLGAATVFLNESEIDLVRRHNLFEGRKVHFVSLRESVDELKSWNIPELDVPIPRIESVPVMALMLAMYLGFTDIAILGVDHDHFLSGFYHYAFELQALRDKDLSVGDKGRVLTSRHDDFQSLARLWRQYRAMRNIADANGIRIVNVSTGGALDEFPRVDLETYLTHTH